jgi:hypothetical protein
MSKENYDDFEEAALAKETGLKSKSKKFMPPPIPIKTKQPSFMTTQTQDDNRSEYSSASTFNRRSSIKPSRRENPLQTYQTKITSYRIDETEENAQEIEEKKKNGREKLRKAIGHQRVEEKERNKDFFQNQLANKIEKSQKLLNWTESIKELYESSYIPFHMFRICQKKIWIERTGNLNPNQSRGTSLIDWKAGTNLWGSRTDYAQGLEIPVQEEPMGDAENTYVCEMTLQKVRNTLPYPIGISIGEMKKTDTGTVAWTLYNGEEYTHEAGATYHGIIPAHFNEPQMKIRIFKSTPQINEGYGAKYTYLTEDKETIKAATTGYGRNKYMVNADSHIAEWIHENYMFYKTSDGEPWILPAVNPDPNEDDKLIVEPYMHDEAVERIQEIVRNMLPVFNLEEFTIKFYPLVTGSAAQLLIKEEKLKKKQLYPNAFKQREEAKEDTRANKRDVDDADAVDVANQGVLTFELNATYMFRNNLSDVEF